MTHQINSEVLDHLAKMGVTDLVEQRFIALLKQCEQICPENIIDAFVTDQSSDDGRILINLWFFSEHYAMEAKNFQLATEFDLNLLSSNIDYVSVASQSYQLGDMAAKNSSLMVKTSTIQPGDMNLTFVASGANCTELDRILRMRLLPHFLKPVD